MAPVGMKTYKNKVKNKRPWASIRNVLSEVKNKELNKPITVFEALFNKNIKGLKSKRTGSDCGNKENDSCAKQLLYKRPVETKLETINAAFSFQDTLLDSTFDRILVGPVFPHPRPVATSHKCKEFDSSSISTSGNQQSNARSSASDPSCVDDTLSPVTWNTRKNLAVPKRRKIQKHASKKCNPATQLRKHKKKSQDMNPCFTSTPNVIRCREKNQKFSFLSPILHIDQKGQKIKVINDKNNYTNCSVHGSVSPSKSHVSILDTRKSISLDIHQVLPSLKGSNVTNEIHAVSVFEENVSKSVSFVSAGVMANDLVIVIEDISSQLQSCKLEGKIVSAIEIADELHGTDYDLRISKESFTHEGQKLGADKQPYMNDSVRTVAVSGSLPSSPVHHDTDINMRQQKNVWTEGKGRSLCRSYDSCPEEFMGFPDVPLEQDSHVDSITNNFCGFSEIQMGQESGVDPVKGEFLSPSGPPLEQDSCVDLMASNYLGSSDVPVGQNSCVDPITGEFLNSSGPPLERDSCVDLMASNYLGSSYVPIGQNSCVDSIPREFLSPSDSPLDPITGVPLDVPVEKDLCENYITDVLPPNLHTSNGDGNKCAEIKEATEGGNVTANLLSTHPESREAVVFDQSQVSKYEVPSNNSEKCSTDMSKHHDLHESLVIMNKSDCKQPRDQTELLCSNISKEGLFQEPSGMIIGTGKLSIPAKIHSAITDVKTHKSLIRQSCRRVSHLVVPGDRISGPQGNLPSFHDVYHNSSFKITRSDLTVAVPEEVENSELHNISGESLVNVFSARDAVLQRCNQHAPISFSEAFPTSYWLTCKKIGEGVYGEVFLSEGQEKSVLKVIPIEGEAVVNGEPQKKFEEILSEVVIAMELSALRNGTENRTSSFSEVARCLCVQGVYPKQLIDLWDSYDKNKGSENDSPAVFTEDQLYIILILAHGGYDLEAHVFTNAEQSHSILIQTGYALAVAEQVLEFEHRDLHWGNVLVSQTTEKNVTFKLCGKEYSVPTKGVKVSIIDFTLSRMTYDGCCIYNDLSKDPALFEAEGDYQFEVYRLMQKHTMNSWHHFNPYTNLLWLHYLLDKICTVVNYRRVSSKTHKQGMKMLMKLRDVVLKYESTQDFVLNEVV